MEHFSFSRPLNMDDSFCFATQGFALEAAFFGVGVGVEGLGVDVGVRGVGWEGGGGGGLGRASYGR